MKPLVERGTEHGLKLIAKLARMLSAIMRVVSLLIGPFFDQGKVIEATDLLKHEKFLFARVGK